MTVQWTPRGEFRHPITFFRDLAKEASRDAATGHLTPDWRQIAVARAKLETGGTRRFEAARQVVANATHVWTMPYQPGLELWSNPEKEEIRWEGRRFAVHAVEDVAGMHRELNVTTVETQTGG